MPAEGDNRHTAGNGGDEVELEARVEDIERRLDAVLLVLEGASGAISSVAAGARRT